MRLVSTLLLLLAFSTLHAEENATSASEAMRAGNYAIAYCIWQPEAEAGDANAQYNIGWLYHNGYGLTVDDRQAEHWWQQASEQGHLEARFALATLYSLGGRGVSKDIDKAIPLYVDTLSTGDEEARLILHNLLMANNKTSRLLATHLQREDWAQLGTIRDVKASRANIRSQATLESSVIDVLDQGASLLEVASQGKWVQIIVLQTGRGGWIYAPLLAPTSP